MAENHRGPVTQGISRTRVSGVRRSRFLGLVVYHAGGREDFFRGSLSSLMGSKPWIAELDDIWRFPKLGVPVYPKMDGL